MEFAMSVLLARALLPQADRRDISHGELVWHTHVFRSAGISTPCNAIWEEGGLVDNDPRGIVFHSQKEIDL